jgi:NAD(P)-dependent dehydrogenase (short-subunit alcohol dehydrogenase family)
MEVRSMAGVEGRVALVTGAGRGIGRAVVELLTARGAQVMGVSRSEQELAALGVEYTVADLGTPEGCALAVEETERRVGPIDVLVCNHGLGSAHERLIWEQDPKVWSEMMQINLDGPFQLSRLVLPGMVERRYGRLVYTSSTAGLLAEYAGSAYTSAKHGLIGLMRSVAQDAGAYGVTSNAVLPGWVRTEMAERSARADAEERGITVEKVWEERAALYPPGRVATPAEVAEMIAFFASEESSGVSGEAVRVALGSVW